MTMTIFYSTPGKPLITLPHNDDTTTLPYSNATTSRAAAKNAGVVSKSGHDRRVICQFVADQGATGATDGEILAGCPGVHPNAIRARRGEAWAHGMLTDVAGERRRGESGCMATVWHITAKGIEALGMPVGSWCVK